MYEPLSNRLLYMINHRWSQRAKTGIQRDDLNHGVAESDASYSQHGVSHLAKRPTRAGTLARWRNPTPPLANRENTRDPPLPARLLKTASALGNLAFARNPNLTKYLVGLAGQGLHSSIPAVSR